MTKLLLLSLAFSLSYAGMIWLALSLKSHWQQLQPHAELNRSQIFTRRMIGAVFIGAALALCFIADKPSIAILVWIMSLTTAALATTYTFSYRSDCLRNLVMKR